jgi:hypothetical protein
MDNKVRQLAVLVEDDPQPLKGRLIEDGVGFPTLLTFPWVVFTFLVVVGRVLRG